MICPGVLYMREAQHTHAYTPLARSLTKCSVQIKLWQPPPSGDVPEKHIGAQLTEREFSVRVRIAQRVNLPVEIAFFVNKGPRAALVTKSEFVRSAPVTRRRNLALPAYLFLLIPRARGAAWFLILFHGWSCCRLFKLDFSPDAKASWRKAFTTNRVPTRVNESLHFLWDSVPQIHYKNVALSCLYYIILKWTFVIRNWHFGFIIALFKWPRDSLFLYAALISSELSKFYLTCGLNIFDNIR